MPLLVQVFLTPGSVVQQAGSKALVVYLIAAIFAAILAISFAAASKYVTKSGAAYAYSKAAFGKKLAFIWEFCVTSQPV